MTENPYRKDWRLKIPKKVDDEPDTNPYKKDWRLIIPKKKIDYMDYIGFIATGVVVITVLVVLAGLSL